MNLKITIFFFALLTSLCGQAQHYTLDEQLYNQILKDTSFQIADQATETHIQYLNKENDSVAVYIIEAQLKKNKLNLEAASPFDKDTFAMQTLQDQIKWKNKPEKKALAGINADFFNMKTGAPVQMAIQNGNTIKDTAVSGRGFVGLKKNQKLFIGDSALYERKKKRLKQALGGYKILVDKGKIIPQSSSDFSKTRHPRTALGKVNNRKVLFVVVDGRQPGYSYGIPLDELALLMKSLGAKTALNLDGGGSSTLISSDPESQQWTIRNRPSGGQLRPIANAWILVEKQ